MNPLATGGYLLSHFHPDDLPADPLPFGGVLHRVDATFGVRGRPQSASNQTAILTGASAPRLLGHHVLGFPNAPLRKLLAERSIVRQLVRAGRKATFANCFPAEYLVALGLRRQGGTTELPSLPLRALRRARASASTLAMAAGEVPLRTLADAREGRALTHDIDGHGARARGLDVPVRTAEEAAEVFWRIASEADFTLFEHYLADEAGHARDFPAAAAALDTFDRFARAVVAARPADAEVLICSDHGNVEDLSTRRHTTNPVPVLSFGSRDGALPPLRTVADVGARVLSLLGVEPSSEAA